MISVNNISLLLYIPIIALVFALGTVSLSFSQNTNWTGAVSDEWENPGNWSNGVPNQNNTAVINWFPQSNPNPVIRSNTSFNTLNINNFGRFVSVTVDDGVEVSMNSLSVAASGTKGQISFNVANGHATINNTMSLNGAIFVDGGSISFLDNFSMGSSSLFEVQTGTVNIGDPGPPVVSANFTQSGGSTFNLNQGTLNIFGSSQFTGGGSFNAGTGNINFNGDIQFDGGSDFNPDESTVNVSGDVTISSNSNQDATFHNLNILEGANVTATVDVTVTNDMDVADGSIYIQDGNTNLNVIGNLTGNPQVSSFRPYIVSLEILDESTIRVNFSETVTSATAENASNYVVREGIQAGSAVVDNISTAPTLGGADNNQVTIIFDALELEEGAEYFLHVQNVENLSGESVNNPHVKRILLTAPPVFFSINDGFWDNAANWSTESHTGAPASRAPGFDGDEVIVGNGNQITISNTVDLQPFVSVTVQNGGTLQVNEQGELLLRDQVVSGDGSFELLSGGTLRIGSPDGIESETMAGNIQTGTRSFSTGGNFIYNGSSSQVTGSALPQFVNHLEINNVSGVSVTNSVQVNGVLGLNQGTFTIGDGLSLIANNKDVNNGELQYVLVIDGQAGYRLLSSPLQVTFENFLSEVLTQGFPGAFFTDSDPLQPNVLWYDETFEGTDNQRWRAPDNITSSVIPGRGYHVYMFDDVSDDNRYNDPLPYTLMVNGLENEGAGQQVGLNVTYTPEGDEGWNLVGNPYGAAIDWDHTSWTKTNIDPTIYVWDPNTNQYQTWNGTVGDIEDGIIAPFQGFWVKANDENPELILSESAKTFGGEFIGKSINPVPSLSIEAYHSENLRSKTHLMFSEAGKFSLDKKDAYKLSPPPGISNYLELFTRTKNNEKLSINNLPLKFGAPIHIPVEMNVYKDGFPVTDDVELNIKNLSNIPNSWTIELRNDQTGERFNVHKKATITVPMDHVRAKGAQKHKSGYEVVSRGNDSQSYFTLIITPNAENNDIPNEFRMHQNYPNPFNPTTTFVFDLPIQSDVRLEVYDVTGRRVAQVINSTLNAGRHEIAWNASALSSGVYIYRLITSDSVHTKKMTLVK